MYKVFWILTLGQWHPHPTTGQVLQSSPTPDLISEEEEEAWLNLCYPEECYCPTNFLHRDT